MGDCDLTSYCITQTGTIIVSNNLFETLSLYELQYCISVRRENASLCLEQGGNNSLSTSSHHSSSGSPTNVANANSAYSGKSSAELARGDDVVDAAHSRGQDAVRSRVLHHIALGASDEAVNFESYDVALRSSIFNDAASHEVVELLALNRVGSRITSSLLRMVASSSSSCDGGPCFHSAASGGITQTGG